MCGDKDYRHLFNLQHLIDSVESGASVSQLNVSKDKARLFHLKRAECLCSCPCHRLHPMANACHQPLEIKCNKRFVLNDEYVSRNLFGNLA